MHRIQVLLNNYYIPVGLGGLHLLKQPQKCASLLA